VKGYLAAGGVRPFKSPQRPKLLDGHEDWLRERFIRHRGNADVVRQDFKSEKGLAVKGVYHEMRPSDLEDMVDARGRVHVSLAGAPWPQLCAVEDIVRSDWQFTSKPSGPQDLAWSSR
jgi:hypothetical protein